MSTRADDGGPELVVVCGLPGVEKTTVSEAVTDRLDAALLRTDVVRTELVEDPEYTEDELQRVYDEVLSRAGDRLESGTLSCSTGRSSAPNTANAPARSPGIPGFPSDWCA